MPFRSAVPLLISVTCLASLVTPVSAQVDGGFQNREEREIFSTSPGGDSGAILDATNPMDLINRIQRAGAMDDATPPSDACLLYTSPSPRDTEVSRMPSSA